MITRKKQERSENTQDIVCPYCGGYASLQDSITILGVDRGPIYICNKYPACDSYVGAHKISLKPMGIPANGELRIWRKQAHQVFDPLWESKSRKRARPLEYRKLAKYLGIPVESCHIGRFDVEMCKQVLEYAKQNTV